MPLLVAALYALLGFEMALWFAWMAVLAVHTALRASHDYRLAHILLALHFVLPVGLATAADMAQGKRKRCSIALALFWVTLLLVVIATDLHSVIDAWVFLAADEWLPLVSIRALATANAASTLMAAVWGACLASVILSTKCP